MSDNIEPYLYPGGFDICLCEAVFVFYFVCPVAIEGYYRPFIVRGGDFAADLDTAWSLN